MNWDIPPESSALVDFVRELIRIRADQPILRRESYRDGMIVNWLNPNGEPQTPEQWEDPLAKSIALRLERPDLEGAYWHDVIIAFNAHDGGVFFTLPEREGSPWQVAIDTAAADGMVLQPQGSPQVIELPPRSLAVLI